MPAAGFFITQSACCPPRPGLIPASGPPGRVSRRAPAWGLPAGWRAPPPAPAASLWAPAPPALYLRDGPGAYHAYVPRRASYALWVPPDRAMGRSCPRPGHGFPTTHGKAGGRGKAGAGRPMHGPRRSVGQGRGRAVGRGGPSRLGGAMGCVASLARAQLAPGRGPSRYGSHSLQRLGPTAGTMGSLASRWVWETPRFARRPPSASPPWVVASRDAHRAHRKAALGGARRRGRGGMGANLPRPLGARSAGGAARASGMGPRPLAWGVPGTRHGEGPGTGNRAGRGSGPSRLRLRGEASRAAAPLRQGAWGKAGAGEGGRTGKAGAGITGPGCPGARRWQGRGPRAFTRRRARRWGPGEGRAWGEMP